MSIPGQYGYEGHEPDDVYGTEASAAPRGGSWPANELEEVLSAALGDPGATPRVVEVLGRSQLWIPLSGGDPASGSADGSATDPADDLCVDLPGLQLHGLPYVPVFSSEEQFRRAAPGMSYAVMSARDFARGLPPGVGMAVNPGGAVGIPLPAIAVEDICRGGVGSSVGGGARGGGYEPPKGGRVRLWEPDSDDEPVDFLAAAAGEFAITPVVLSARRALGSVEGERPTLFIGVELDRWQEEDRAAAMDALGRALSAEPVPWTVNLLLLDVAQDPLTDLMHDRITPFFSRD
ncbi:MAG: enhanced serine sensitivity protein SseB [Streptomycetaceae bacterium]|nr:enhanced serine sensitivity protein SseB [Streptomycetaceae bacterium]